MNKLKATSLQSLQESDRGSNDSLLTGSLQLDLDEVFSKSFIHEFPLFIHTHIFFFIQLNDDEYLLPPVDFMPSLESVLNDLDAYSDTASENLAIPLPTPSATPTPSLDDHHAKAGTILRHIILQGVTAQVSSAVVSAIKSCIVGIFRFIVIF